MPPDMMRFCAIAAGAALSCACAAATRDMLAAYVGAPCHKRHYADRCRAMLDDARDVIYVTDALYATAPPRR